MIPVSEKSGVGQYSPIRIACAAAVICLLVYLRTLACGFVNLDDPDYVLNNMVIRDLDGNSLVTMFTAPHAGFWMPLTWISLAIDYKLWGLNPAGYHVTNILLHAANTFLVVLVTDRLLQAGKTEPSPFHSFGSGGWAPPIPGAWEGIRYPVSLFLAGVLWGLHPLRVESVAWITERKDVLSGLFFLGSLICYLGYMQERMLKSERRGFSGRYLLSFVLFILAMMAKSVSVVLPAMLLVLDWYPLNRLQKVGIRHVVAEKIPFLLGSAAMSVATLFIAHNSHILAGVDTLTLVQRTVIAGNALFEYCRMIVWPVGILPLYIIDASNMPDYLLKTIAFVVASTGIVFFRKSKWLAVTWLSFVIPLLPVLGFFQNGIQAFASRFTYIPAVAPSIAAACLITWLFGKSSRVWRGTVRTAIIISISVLIACYGIGTWRLISIWNNTGTVWSRIIDIRPTGRAYKERGLYNLTSGNYRSAAEDLTSSIVFADRAGLPEIYNLYAYRGVTLEYMGKYAEAIEDFTRALSLCPRPNYYLHRGRSLEALGNRVAAEADYQRAGTANGLIVWERGRCE